MDLNRLKKYHSDETIEKVAEKIHSFWYEVNHTKNNDKVIGEGLGVIQVLFNYLRERGMTNEDFELHIEKMEVHEEEKVLLEEQLK